MANKLSRIFDDSKLKEYAPIFLRYSFVVVFLYFSLAQLIQPTHWVAYVPEHVTGIASAETFVFLNAIFELICAILLALGIYPRIVALLLALHLFGITYTIGFNQTGARDFGLACATLAIAMFGRDKWCLENKWRK
ncbi:MAG TPA: DoxX family protein [Alphaproteobacteria bacterium]|nr:DoxX family protein [Alphaproteobacteria bacterium]